ncbi:hypothetical protein JCM5350_003391 [Sporobolomyces pararoseus]
MVLTTFRGTTEQAGPPSFPLHTPPLENETPTLRQTTANSSQLPSTPPAPARHSFPSAPSTYPEQVRDQDSSAADPIVESPLSSEIETSSGPCSLSEIVAERWRNSDEATKRRYLSQEADETRSSSERSKEEEDARIADDSRMCEVNGRAGESSEED